jgi:hypothetical protein
MEIARHVGGLERQWTKKLRRAAIEGTSEGQYTHHGVGLPIEDNLLAGYPLIGAKSVPPEHAAQHDHFFLPELIFVSKEKAPQCGLHAEDVEKVDANAGSGQHDRVAATGQHHAATSLRSHVLEHRVLRPPIQVVERRDAIASGRPAARRLFQDPDDPITGGVRQRVEQRRAHEAEDRRVGANADGQRQNCHRCEAGCVTKRAKRIA